MNVQPSITRVDSVYSDSIDSVSIRLLRFSRSEHGALTGKLHTFRLAEAPKFYTASYVWGERADSGTSVLLNTGPLTVLPSLVPFLNMVAQHDDFTDRDYFWIDFLCINQYDLHEREKQVEVMAEIYKRAKRAIVWLGEEKEEGSDCTGAIEFLHHLAGLQVAFSGDDSAMRANPQDSGFTKNCEAVSNLLFRPWWTRVRPACLTTLRTVTS